MKTSSYKFLIFCIAIVFFSACKKETDTVNFDYGYNYFPDDSGSYIIYKVDSVIYNDFDILNLKRKSSLYLKEIITERFVDNLGRSAKKVERYVTDSLNHPWIFFNVWYIVKNTTNVEKVEDNVRYIKLTFPLSQGNTWKGNKYNLVNHFPYVDLKFTTTNFDWNYNLKELNVNYTDDFIDSDSSLTVLQVADSSDVQKVYSVEKYARNIGLVYKELWRLDAQLVDNQSYEDNAVFGFILRQYAVDYGKE